MTTTKTLRPWSVALLHNHRLVEVRIRDAARASEARRRALALYPDAAHLSTTRYYRFGKP